jgi:hypothetical protein
VLYRNFKKPSYNIVLLAFLKRMQKTLVLTSAKRADIDDTMIKISTLYFSTVIGKICLLLTATYCFYLTLLEVQD